MQLMGAKFAPTEDLSKYPRTLQRDLELLSTLLPDISDHSHSPATGEATPTPTPGRQSEMGEAPPPPLVIFNPSDEVMYPLRGNLQDLKQKRGAEVDVKGWGDVMEGASRRVSRAMPRRSSQKRHNTPADHFSAVLQGRGDGVHEIVQCRRGGSPPLSFPPRGCAHAVQPDHAYFGQKDIQQALLLRISTPPAPAPPPVLMPRSLPADNPVLKDLLISHPTPENMHIIPTSRDPHTHLALSSRNAYLSQAEMKVAPTLYRALSTAKDMFAAGGGVTGEGLVSAATAVVLEQQRATGTDANMGLEVGPREEEKVQVELDYIEVFDKETFEPVRGEVESGRELVIAGAIWVGRTRLIDNLLLGWDM